MALVDELRALMPGADARSFQLMGEDLALIPGASLRAAADAYDAELAAVAPSLPARFEAEQAALQRDAHGWLSRYNRSIHTRVRGYLELGRRLEFAYPWPVVAILGICQVMTGLTRTHLYGLLGPWVRRAGFAVLEEIAEGSDDLLRRTNRGIFADSVPTVLLALRCRALAAAGEAELAEALLGGPLPPLMDAQSRTLARELVAGLAVVDADARFRALADLTLRHFEREQAIFTFHLGGDRSGRPGGRREPVLVRRLSALGSVPAPVVVRGLRGRRVEFRPYKLPPGFDLRHHAARVAEFGRAFVTSVTASAEDYAAAVAYVERRFG